MSHISDEQIENVSRSIVTGLHAEGFRGVAWQDFKTAAHCAIESFTAPASAPTVQADDAITLTDRIAELIEQHGSLRAAARALQTNPGYLCRLASGEKSNPGEEVLTCMGLRAVTTYERIKP